ncbi:MAG: hypothetical protein F6K19_13415, partial [Cyanothece sp. SIO1E1]|nr:hypothetical protein [Cyanothece sp. SIO1E1]
MQSAYWNKASRYLFVGISLLLLGYWIYRWQQGLTPYGAEGDADLAGFIRWLLGYVFLLAVILGAALLNHRLLYRKLVSRQIRLRWVYFSWLLVLWWILFELFQN